MNTSINQSDTPMWQLHIDEDQVAWLEIDNPASSVNTLSSNAMKALDKCISEVSLLNPKALVIISKKKSGFIAGADIKEFTTLTHSLAYDLVRSGQKVLDRLEQLPFPTVSAIHGFALGGGLELALACTYRVAASDIKTSLGLPEVQLGIHPGFGGTVRAVQLLGPLAAMDLILTGKTINSEKAHSIGLVDHLSTLVDLRTEAKRFALKRPPKHQPTFFSRLVNSVFFRSFVARKLIKEVAKRANAKHYPAPYAVIDLWKRYGAQGSNAYEAEAQSIAALFTTASSQNLVRVFILQDRLKNLGTKAEHPIKHVHVVGAGVMGGDIASWCAANGLEVSIQDRDMKFIQPALDRARAFFDKRFKNDSKKSEVLSRLEPDVEGTHVSRSDIVIEAIFENVAAKKELYRKLESQLQPDAIIATNTSSIVLEMLATELQDPGRFIGLHFFNPVSRMPLVEIIHSEQTRAEVVQRSINFARQIDKLPVPCRSAPGFVVNRILMPYLNEAMRAVDEGVPLALLDKIACDFGMPMGPIELADVIGLDVCLHVGAILAQAYSRPQANIIKQLVEQKKLGKKSGEGFYVWKDGKPIKPPVKNHPIPPHLQDRLILSMVNESMAVLREQVVSDSDLLDAAVIFGTGFAPFRGGPLQYARSVGTAKIKESLEQLAIHHGAHFKPDSGWDNANW